MKIYYLADQYPEIRNIIGIDDNNQYICINRENGAAACLEKLWRAAAFRVADKLGEKTLPCFWYLPRKGVIHTFNSVVLGKNRWCATFESYLPRNNQTRSRSFCDALSDRNELEKGTLFLYRQLAKENCLGCIALSETTRKMQMNVLRQLDYCLGKENAERIMKKTYVLHPPQKIMITEEEFQNKFNEKGPLKLIFIGHDFFRKGGKEVLDVLSGLADRYSFHLTVVSRLDYKDYATDTSRETMLHYKEILKHTKWITYFETLENEKVLELSKEAHIGLLPTFADTYGYSILEMQACGCSVMTTDIRALPEINNEECGWVVRLPKGEFGEADYSSEEKRAALKDILTKGLFENFEEIFSVDRSVIKEKARLSLERVRKEHDPAAYAKHLQEIYMQQQLVK